MQKVLEEIGGWKRVFLRRHKQVDYEIENNDGFLTPIDLKNYEVVRKDLSNIYSGHNVITVPRPSTGTCFQA